MHHPAASRPPSDQTLRDVLVVDDDPDIRELVEGYLSAYGFRVHVAADAAAARRLLGAGEFAVVVLDLNLPDEDGLDLIRMISERHHTPLIVVSARSSAVERIIGLELGADDYLVKPFDPRELLARVRRLLKRRAPAERAAPAPDAAYRFGPFRLEPRARRLLDAAGEEIALTGGEFELLLALLERPQHLLSRNELMLRTHGRKATPFERIIDVQIGRLRRKLQTDAGPEALIRSVRNGGYLLAVPVTRGDPG